MFSIKNFKKLADVQDELRQLKEQVTKEIETKVHPAMEDAISDLFKGLMNCFESKGLEVFDNGNSFVAQYKDGKISIEKFEEGRALSIYVNNQEVDKIYAVVIPGKHNSFQEDVDQDEFRDEILNIQREIKEYKGLMLSYSNLNVLFENKNKIQFMLVNEVINNYFI